MNRELLQYGVTVGCTILLIGLSVQTLTFATALYLFERGSR